MHGHQTLFLLRLNSMASEAKLNLQSVNVHVANMHGKIHLGQSLITY